MIRSGKPAVYRTQIGAGLALTGGAMRQAELAVHARSTTELHRTAGQFHAQEQLLRVTVGAYGIGDARRTIEARRTMDHALEGLIARLPADAPCPAMLL